MKRIYAGIGSRQTPTLVLKKMTKVAARLEELGFTLRSGGARGADRAFEAGCTRKEIYYASDATPEAIRLASRFHPAWHRCSDYARKLHGRNMFIVLGKDLQTPVDFIVCWTKDGGPTGGTGQALRIAKEYRIPVFNLYFKDALENLGRFLKTKGVI